MANAVRRLLADIRELAPGIAARAAEIEDARRIPPDLVETLRSIGVFRMFVPQSHGGLELDLPAALEVIGALGRIDGSVGWTAMIGAGSRKVMCGCPRRCKRSLDGAGDDRVRSCVRPRSAALPHAAGRYGDTQTRCRSKTASAKLVDPNCFSWPRPIRSVCPYRSSTSLIADAPA
jgi:hypothetical protein